MAKTSVDNKYVRASIQNVQTDEITISEDKLRNKLERQFKYVKESSGTLSYLSVAITCVGVLVSTDFKEALGLTPDMWKMLFIIVAVVFAFFFVKRGIKGLLHRVTVDTIVNDIKTLDQTSHDESFWHKFVNAIFTKMNKKSIEEEEKK